MDTSNLTIVASESTPVLKAHALGSSIYDPLIERLDGMQVGDHFELPLPKGTKTCVQFQSRVSAGLAPRIRAKGKDYSVKIRQIADDRGLAVYKIDARPPKRCGPSNPAPKPVKAAKRASKPAKKARKSKKG